ncbi:MAG: septum formation initiator family protein [Nitrospirota bacterium]
MSDMRGRIRPKNLRQQVAVESKRRTVLFFSIVSVAFLYLSFTLLFGNMGFLKYNELKKTKSRLESEITTLEQENKQLKQHVTALKQDPFYIEKHAREEYGLAKPDEYIFQFNDNAR